MLVNSYGEPVTRCYCGNPLTPAPTSGYEPTYYGPTWSWWRPGNVTVIQQNVTIINNYTLVNIYNGKPFNRVGGDDTGTGDKLTTPTTTATPTPPLTPRPPQSTPAPQQPRPQGTISTYSAPPRPQTPRPQTPTYTSSQAIAIWDRARARCNSRAFPYEDFGNNYRRSATPTGIPGVFAYRIDGYPPSGRTLTFTWEINVRLGTLIPTNALARDSVRYCSALQNGYQ